MTILQNIFSAAPKKSAILLRGVVLLATVFASVGCAQPQSVLGGKNIGFSVPFRLAPLSAAAVTISVYPGYDTKRLSGDAAESILRELKDLYTSSTERTLTGDTLPMLSAEGTLIGHAQYDSPLVK